MDSWEDADDDFVPNIPLPSSSGNWDDEEDETLKKQDEVPVELSAAQKALIKKKQDEAELTLSNKVRNAQLENETSDERKIRERKAVEESDGQLANDLFDNVDNANREKKKPKSTTSSIASISLSTKADHVNFGIAVATRLEESTPFSITAFLKEVLTRTQNQLTVEGVNELHAMLTKVKDSRKVAEDTKNNVKGKQTSQKSKKASAKVAKERFGDSDYVDEYDEYSNMEDDYHFM